MTEEALKHHLDSCLDEMYGLASDLPETYSQTTSYEELEELSKDLVTELGDEAFKIFEEDQ